MLPKNLREKKRYILCRLIFPDEMQLKTDLNTIIIELKREFFKQIFFLYGDVGAANINAKIIYSLKNQKNEIYFIVLCNYKFVEYVQFCLANICKIEEAKIIVNILKISGTQKQLKKEL